MTQIPEQLAERFWSLVTYPNGQDGCWEWIGSKTEGYGRIYVDSRHAIRAHRFAYEFVIGPIPTPELDHLCRNRGCVNPAHLEPVTTKENTLRGFGPTAKNARKEACPVGHVYSRRRHNGQRICQTCANRRTREWRKRVSARRKSNVRM